MIKVNKFVNGLSVIVWVLLVIITVCGVCSFQTGYSYQVVNQYGENIRIWGAGIYAHDSFFKAPIFIGSNFTILMVAVPLMIISFYKLKSKPALENYIQCFSISSLLLYYSASLAFGVTYNRLHLAYMALFGGCLFYNRIALCKIIWYVLQTTAIMHISYSKRIKSVPDSSGSFAFCSVVA